VGTQVAIKICQQPCNCYDIFTLSWYINIVKLQLCTKEILLRNLMHALLRLIVRDTCLIWYKLCQDASVGNWWYHFLQDKRVSKCITDVAHTYIVAVVYYPCRIVWMWPNVCVCWSLHSLCAIELWSWGMPQYMGIPRWYYGIDTTLKSQFSRNPLKCQYCLSISSYFCLNCYFGPGSQLGSCVLSLACSINLRVWVLYDGNCTVWLL